MFRDLVCHGGAEPARLDDHHENYQSLGGRSPAEESGAPSTDANTAETRLRGHTAAKKFVEIRHIFAVTIPRDQRTLALHLKADCSARGPGYRGPVGRVCWASFPALCARSDACCSLYPALLATLRCSPVEAEKEAEE